MKLIIRNSNGEITEQEITENLQLSPSAGEQYFFTGVENYTFELTDNNSSLNVHFLDDNGERINIVLNNMAELIQQNNPMDPFSIDTTFGVSTNEAGNQAIENTLKNEELESGEIVEALKEALSMDGSTLAGGAVIDDFQALLESLDASATGDAQSQAYNPFTDDDRDQDVTPAESSDQERPDSYDDRDSSFDRSTGDSFINHDPTLDVIATANVDEDGVKTIKFTANDIDGDTLTTNVTALNGTVSVENGEIVYRPNENYNGSDTITVTVDDGNGGSVTKTIDITVDPVNDLPTVEAVDTVYVNEDGIVSGRINASDIDGDSLTFTTESNIEGLTLNPDGTYTFDADSYDSLDLGENQILEVPVTVSDGNGGEVQTTLTIDVSGVNNDITYVSETAGYRNVIGYYELDENGNPTGEAKVIIDDQNGMAGGTHLDDLDPNTEYGFFIIANGAREVDETSVITFDNSGDIPVLLIDGEAATKPVYHDTPSFNWDGKDHFVFESDGEGGTNINIEDLPHLGDGDFKDVVLNVNFEISDKIGDDVQARNDVRTVDEDTSITIDVLRNDRDGTGDELTITDVQNPVMLNGVEVGSAEIVAGKIVFTPNDELDKLSEGEVQNLSFKYTVSDGNLGEDTATVTLKVQGTNDAPEIEITGTRGLEDTAQVIGNVSDIDGTIESSNLTAQNGEVNIDLNGNIIYIPNDDFNGTDSVTISVTDNNGATTTQTLNVTVEAVNDGPVATDDILSGGGLSFENATLLGELNFDDANEYTQIRGRSEEIDGQVGNAAEFTNSKTEMTGLDLSSEDGAQTTVTMMVKANPDGGWEMLAGSDRYDLVLRGGDIGFNTARGDMYGADASALDDGEWHHIVATFTNGDVTQNSIYIDGEPLDLGQIGSRTFSESQANIDSANDTMYFGGWGANNNYKFTGSMDEIKVFDGSMSHEEVQALYNQEMSGEKFSEASGAATEDTVLIINASELLANDTDVDGDTLTITEVNATDATHGTVSLDANGNIVFTPEANYNGAASFTYTVDDGNGGTDTATVTLNVISVNDIPTIDIQSTATVNEDGTLTIGADSWSATDIEDGNLTPTFSADNGTVSLDNNGNIVYTPNENYNGSDTITVSVTDSNGAVTTETINVTVESINDGPIATDDVGGVKTVEIPITNASFEEDANSRGSWDRDADGWDQTGSSGDFDHFDRTEDNNAAWLNGGGTISQILGETLGTDSTYTLNIDMGNRADVAGGSDYTINLYAGGEVIGTVNQDDFPLVNGEFVTANISVDTATLPEGFSGFGEPIKIEIVNNETSSNWRASQIAVDDVSLTKTVVNDIAADEDTALTIDSSELLANDIDVDGDTLTITEVNATDATHGTVSLDGNGNVVFTPEVNYNGPASFTYTISDGQGGTDTATVSLNVTAVNDLPTIDVVGQTTVSEDGSKTISFTTDDIDGDNVSVIGRAGSGTVTIENGEITYTPKENFNGSDTITVQVNDGNGGVVTKTIDVTVDPVNDAPIIEVQSSASVNEDGSLTIDSTDWSAIDIEDGNLTPNLSANNGSVEIDNNGNIVYTPNENYNGADTITVSVTDSNGAMTTETINITVEAVNDGISDLSDSDNTQNSIDENVESGTYTGVTLNATDVDGDTITYSLPDDVPFKVLDNGQVVTDGAIDFESNGSYTFTATATSSDGTSSSMDVTINVNDIVENVDPEATDDVGDIISEGTVLASGLDGFDNVSGDSLTLSKNDSSASNSFDFGSENAGNTVSITFDAQALGSWDNSGKYEDTFIVNGEEITLNRGEDAQTFTVNAVVGDDGTVDIDFGGTITGGDEGVAVTNLSVTAVGNDWISNGLTTDEDSSITVDVLANDTDVDGDTLSITEIQGQDVSNGQSVNITLGGVVVGTALVADGQIQFTPGSELQDMNDGDNTDVTFEYTVSDGQGGTDTANVTINVTGVTDGPVDETHHYKNVQDDTHSTVDEDFTGEVLETADGNDTIIVDDDVDDARTINTNEGDDTITVGDDVQNGSSINTGAGNDSVSLTGNGAELDKNSSIDTGTGNDSVSIGDDIQYNSSVTTGEGDDIVNVGDDVQHNSSIDTGTGNDTVNIGGDVENATITTGEGDDSLTIGAELEKDSRVDTGTGNDTVEITKMKGEASLETGTGDDTVTIDRIQDNSTIDTGVGDDRVTLNDVSSSFDGGNVTLGEGSDTLVINDSLRGTDAIFDGGDGVDNLVLNNVSQEEWNDGIKDQFTNFENVTFSDGTTLDLTDTRADEVILNMDIGDVQVSQGGDSSSSESSSTPGSEINSANSWWTDNEVINGTEGSDTINIGEGHNKEINAGGGDDTINTPDGAWKGQGHEIDGGEGNDTLVINGVQDNGTVRYDIIDNGDGTHTIKSVEYNQWSEWDAGYEVTIENIENIQFNDGTVGLDGQPIATTYSYDISFNAQLTDTDGSESLSDITVDTLPFGTTLTGDNVTDNGDGTFTVGIDENGDATATLESLSELSQNELNDVTASVTSTETSTGDTSSMSITDDGEISFLDDMESIDFGVIAANSEEIHTVNLESEPDHTLTLDVDDIVNANNDHEMVIVGHDGDVIDLEGEGWTKQADHVSVDGEEGEFDVYSSIADDGTTASVYVETDVTVHIQSNDDLF